MGHSLTDEAKTLPFESDDIYKVEAVRRACELLKAFESDTEVLRLRDLVARTSISTTTAFRLIHTLEQQGLLEKVGRNTYRSRVKIRNAIQVWLCVAGRGLYIRSGVERQYYRGRSSTPSGSNFA